VTNNEALDRRRRERAAFHELLDLAPEQRAAKLAEIGRDDRLLAVEVGALLREADLDAEHSRDGAPSPIGTLIDGRFRLLRRLGVGGMGEVYLAERSDHVEQQVAIKLVRSDLPTPLARARRERQILARLSHPNIATLIDAGVEAGGQPWFAMEYVDGERITHWCDRHARSLPARARLLAQVARAVQFAHRNLVLHRDLKPSNILVDAEGAPKLLDFGIAKLLDAGDTEQTQTLALTPAYASPEQLRGEPATTASDVYQLGLLLYELQSGAAPRKKPAGDSTTAPRMDQAFAAAMQRDGEGAARIARQRGLTPDKLLRALKGDLSRIVSRALAADPRERYETAQAFADDLDRWSTGQPVMAQRGTLAYRAGKLIQRHALATAAITVLSVGLVATAAIALGRARSERLQRVAAERQHARAETLLGFLRAAFREGDPEHTHGEKLGAADLLARASDRLERRSDLDDPTRGLLSIEIADALHKLGQTAAARPIAQRAVALLAPLQDAQPQAYLQSVGTLASVLIDLGDYLPATERITPALALAARTPAGEHVWTPYLLAYRGYALSRLDRNDDASADLQAALSALDESEQSNGPDRVTVLTSLAVVESGRGNKRKALELYRRVAALDSTLSPATDTDLLATRTDVASNLYALGDAETAAAMLGPVVAQYDRWDGPAHGATVEARSLLGLCELALGDYTAAAATFDAAPASSEALASVEPTTQWQLWRGRAKLALYTHHLDAALAILRTDPDSASLLPRLTPAHRPNWDWLIGETQLQQGAVDDALATLERARSEALASAARIGRQTGAQIGAIEDSLGRAWFAKGDLPEAIRHLDEALRHFRADRDAISPSTELRSQIHRIWLDTLMTRDGAKLQQLSAQRAALVEAMGGEARPQVWQFDLLVDAAAKALGRPGIDAGRRARGEAGIAAFTGVTQPPAFVGLNGF
jgi:serine/threonine-protein kinase